MKLSVIIPVYQGARAIGRITDELVTQLSADGLEIVLVNDGSKDNSNEACIEIFKKHRGIVKYINLAKNFGEHNAVLAGLNHAAGDYAVIIDDDFQNPPEEVLKVVTAAVNRKYDVVYTYYDEKFHSLFRNLGSKFNDAIANFLMEKPKGLYLSSFKCLSRFVINEIIKYKGPYPYIDGLILRTTQNIGMVLVKHQKRREGKSGYSLRKLIRLWLNMFINFSVFPLRISTLLGFLFSMLGGILSIYLIIDKINHPDIPTGVTSIIVAILLFSGLQLTMLGLIGEYIGKQFLTNNQTPQYVIRDIFSQDAPHGKK